MFYYYLLLNPANAFLPYRDMGKPGDCRMLMQSIFCSYLEPEARVKRYHIVGMLERTQEGIVAFDFNLEVPVAVRNRQEACTLTEIRLIQITGHLFLRDRHASIGDFEFAVNAIKV